jgi:hypothetical protein
VNDSKEAVVRRWRIILFVCQRREPDFAHLVLRLWTETSYEIQHRKIVERVEVKLVLRIHDRQALVVDETVRSENVERQVLVRMWSAFPIPLFADGGCVAIGVQDESFAGRWQNVAEDLAPYFGRNPQ